MFLLAYLGFLILVPTICFAIACVTGVDYMLIALIAFFGIILVGTFVGELEKMKTPEGREQMRKEVEEQEKYDNEWGVIDYHDHDKK